jgi:hypothetical protein
MVTTLILLNEDESESEDELCTASTLIMHAHQSQKIVPSNSVAMQGKKSVAIRERQSVR